MIYIDCNTLNNYKVNALQTCVDLIRDGYTVAFSAALTDHWFVRLKHRCNKRALILRVYDSEWTLSEGNKIIKKCPDV